MTLFLKHAAILPFAFICLGVASPTPDARAAGTAPATFPAGPALESQVPWPEPGVPCGRDACLPRAFPSAAPLASVPADSSWDDRFAVQGLDGPVRAVVADAAGSVYVTGDFTLAGGVPVNGIARWDGTAWSPLGSGIAYGVEALAVDASGNLYAAGSFTVAGGVNASNIARWDGAAWSPLGSGLNSTTSALAVDPSGNVYAGGLFWTAGGVGANRVAKWNGSTWRALGTRSGGEVLGDY